MANYNKSFNFRNGVQVDDDNFIVNANGLVGIGTSIPREFLDVHGTAKITGLVTATNLAVTGVSTFYSDAKVGSGITMYASTGIVSATAFYGDGGNLLNVEQVAVDGWIVNAGNLSTTSKVGIGTTLPYYSLQVGLDPLTGNGFSVDATTGNVNATGILTASSFFGNIVGNINSSGVSTFFGGTIGNVTGNVTGNINSSGVSTFSGGILGNVTGNVNSSGVSTFSGGILGNVTGNVTGDVTGDVTGNVTGNINSSGVSTFSGGILGNVTGNINSSGVSTFSGGILGNVTGNVNSSGVSTFSGGILGNVTGNVNSSGVSTFSGGILGNVTGNITGIASTARDLTSDSRVNITNVSSQTSTIGISTVSTRLYAESIGVGTNSPLSDIHIRRTTASSLQITSDTVEATITLGRSTSLNESNGALRFGNTSGLYPYSTEKTLDIINYDTGNINQYLHFGFSGVGTGNFNWFYGQSASNPLMSLTYEGNLGLGITNPTSKLYVVGSSYITGITTVNNNLNVNGNINCSGNLNGNISNINATGVSTFSTVIINGLLDASIATSTFGSVGIETSEPIGLLQVGSGDEFGTVIVATASTIGVSTTIIVGIDTSGITLGLTILEDDSIIASGTTVVSIGTNQVGIGTTTLNDSEGNDISLSFGNIVNDRVFVIDDNKSVGIGTTNPTDKLTVRGGDISVGINTSQGLILTSADGTKYRLFVSSAGVLSTVLVP
jgi:hypothetical protein